MKKKILWVTLAVLLVCAAAWTALHLPLRANAQRRVEAFVQKINYEYDRPEKIYAYMTQDYRNSISRADFVEAFHIERSYPYLTPLFLNFLSMQMEPGNKTGTAHFSQAARLGGTYYDISLVYENFNYYMAIDAYAGFPDDSYLEKFERIPSYLIHGWEVEAEND